MLLLGEQISVSVGKYDTSTPYSESVCIAIVLHCSIPITYPDRVSWSPMKPSDSSSFLLLRRSGFYIHTTMISQCIIWGKKKEKKNNRIVRLTCCCSLLLWSAFAPGFRTGEVELARVLDVAQVRCTFGWPLLCRLRLHQTLLNQAVDTCPANHEKILSSWDTMLQVPVLATVASISYYPIEVCRG